MLSVRSFSDHILIVLFVNPQAESCTGGLLAAAISNMHGVGGKPGWAWIFILEGLFTILVGVASFWVVQDFPDTARFLSEEESSLYNFLLVR